MNRAFELLLTILGVVVLHPVFLLIMLFVRLKLGSPVFFVQVRPGLHGKPFRMVKFRSMTEERDSAGNLLSDAERLTTFGRFLRATSLDELPELWNVLKGEMSLVGPRPLLMEYLPLYSPEQASRHSVRPGITGLAQVSGRNAISWEEKFKLDAWYVQNRTLLLDVRILWLTIGKILRRDGICQSGSATADKFKGNI